MSYIVLLITTHLFVISNLFGEISNEQHGDYPMDEFLAYLTLIQESHK